VVFQNSIIQTPSEIYIAYDRVPTLSDYDYAGIVPFESDQEIMVPTTKAGRYYLLVVARDLPQGIDSEEITLSDELMSFSLTRITPAVGGAGGRVTCTLNGAGFRETTKAFLRKADGSLLEGKVVEFVSTMQMKVRWDLTDVALGTYDVVVKNADGSTVEYPKGFTVETSTGMKVETATLSANTFRDGGIAPMTFQFKNTGNVDIPYLKVNLIFPTYVQTKSISNTPGFFKKSDLYKNYPDISIPDFNYATSDFGGNTITEFNMIEFIAKDVSPYNLLESIIIFSGLKFPEFPVQILVTTMSISEYIVSEIDKIESMRLYIIENSSLFDNNVISLAINQTIFRDTFLQIYIENGLLDSQELYKIIDSYNSLSSYSDNKRIKRASAAGLLCNIAMWGVCVAIHELICAPVFAIPGAQGAAIICAINMGIKCTVGTYFICDQVEKSQDPNEIIGPAGYDAKKWISKDRTLPYNILFENDPELATAPAQVVSIRQTLDTHLDARTFRLGSFGFGDNVFNVPENTSYYSSRLDLVSTLGIYVDVSAGIDINTNEAFWIFRSIDPLTGQAPANPFAGFLPVNDPAIHNGEGFVNYTIRPKKDTVTGDVINAQAKIVFDVNAPIDTPQIFNTIDAGLPASQLNSTAEFINETTVRLNWSGQDVSGGSGLKSYTVYLSTDDSPYEIYEANLSDTSALISLSPGHKYRFFVLSEDNAGNREAFKTGAELFINTGYPELSHAVSALKILAGLPADYSGAKINDAKVGMEEVLFNMQGVAGLR